MEQLPTGPPLPDEVEEVAVEEVAEATAVVAFPEVVPWVPVVEAAAAAVVAETEWLDDGLEEWNVVPPLPVLVEAPVVPGALVTQTPSEGEQMSPAQQLAPRVQGSSDDAQALVLGTPVDALHAESAIKARHISVLM